MEGKMKIALILVCVFVVVQPSLFSATEIQNSTERPLSPLGSALIRLMHQQEKTIARTTSVSTTESIHENGSFTFLKYPPEKEMKVIFFRGLKTTVQPLSSSRPQPTSAIPPASSTTARTHSIASVSSLLCTTALNVGQNRSAKTYFLMKHWFFQPYHVYNFQHYNFSSTKVITPPPPTSTTPFSTTPSSTTCRKLAVCNNSVTPTKYPTSFFLRKAKHWFYPPDSLNNSILLREIAPGSSSWFFQRLPCRTYNRWFPNLPNLQPTPGVTTFRPIRNTSQVSFARSQPAQRSFQIIISLIGTPEMLKEIRKELCATPFRPCYFNTSKLLNNCKLINPTFEPTEGQIPKLSSMSKDIKVNISLVLPSDTQENDDHIFSVQPNNQILPRTSVTETQLEKSRRDKSPDLPGDVT